RHRPIRRHCRGRSIVPMRASNAGWSTLLLVAAVCAQDEARFLDLARQGAADLGIDKPPAEVTFDGDLVPRALVLRLGALELLYPAHALDSPTALADLQQCAAAVCDLQRLFVEWLLLGTKAPAPGEVAAASKEVQRWIKGWRWPLGDQPLHPDEPTAATLARFTAAVAAALGRDPAAVRAQVWLAPTRRAFTGTCALLGATAPENRELLWHEHVLLSSEGWASRPRVLQIVAMEYAPPGELSGEVEGIRMDARDKDGLRQHVVQRCASSLAVLAFGDAIDRDFEAGLCQNLVIALLGENNARTGGSGRGAYAAARSKFVPGGASSGGKLPPIDLDSQWRKTKGRDHFIKPLKQGLKAGLKAADDKPGAGRLAPFLLLDDQGNPGHVVHAPFLTSSGATLPGVPASFDADFKELLRAYRSGFVHWLRDVAGRGTADSRQRFGALLRFLAEGQGRVTFADACKHAFGEADLEPKFAAWLAR